MKLYDLLDRDKLQAHIDNKMIGAQRHPTLPLVIYNYTHDGGYANLWGDGVIDYCRGLIVDIDNNIVARPFKKFHNLNTEGVEETLEAHLYKMGVIPEITEKLDGSLGIFWRYGSYWGVASRGSFTSRQATWATNWYTRQVATGVLRPFFAKEFTPLFEIVYPENRIVVDYKDFSGLVLIGSVNKHYGVEMPHESLVNYGSENGFNGKYVVKLHSQDVLRKTVEEKNREGFVMTFHRPDQEAVKVKVKFDEYVRIHRIVTTTSPKKIWELVSTGEELGFIDKAPEHFKVWANKWVSKITADYDEIYTQTEEIFMRRPEVRRVGQRALNRQERAENARFFIRETQNRPELLPALFGMLDQSTTLYEYIWKSVKPRGDDRTFIRDGE